MVTAWDCDGKQLDFGDYSIDIGAHGEDPWESVNAWETMQHAPIGYTEKAERFVETPHAFDDVETFIASDGEPALRLVKKLAFRHQVRTRTKAECNQCDGYGAFQVGVDEGEDCDECDGKGWDTIDNGKQP